jgi:hypothetical protein
LRPVFNRLNRSPWRKVLLLQGKDMTSKKKLLREIVDEGLSVRQLQGVIDRVVIKGLPAEEKAPALKGLRLPRPVLTILELDVDKLMNPKRLRRLDRAQLPSYLGALDAAIVSLQRMARRIKEYQDLR